MRKVIGILILLTAAVIAIKPVKASDPLTDCLNEASDERDIGMEWCLLMNYSPGDTYACLSGVSSRYINDSVACHVKYDN